VVAGLPIVGGETALGVVAATDPLRSEVPASLAALQMPGLLLEQGQTPLELAPRLRLDGQLAREELVECV
jgi:hypothetical protein